jgi:predicted AlkP superfamily pyrophosphatase or phosphodiesterase
MILTARCMMGKLRYVWLSLLVLGCLSCNSDGLEAPESYVVMVSFDGFRWDYTDLYDTPNFDSLAANGVKAGRMIPSFPTNTFPNHYTLATGLYPDHHGIISNSFFANDLGKVYRISDRSMVQDPDAYFGEPIWVTAEQQGVRSASYFWVGSEAPIMGARPAYWKEYDESIPFTERVDQVIDWLKLPVRKRPALILLYFHEPDEVAHDFGPEHPETGRVVNALDSILGRLRTGIAQLELADRVNLVVLSDHGMGPISPDRYVNLNDYLEKSWTDRILGSNPIYMIDPAEGFADSVTASLNRVEGVSAWQREDIPARLHYGSSPRFPGIVVVADSLWSIGTKSDPSGFTGGSHGYDNAYTDMHTIFMAEGPAFKKGYVRPCFENVEVYGIIAHVLGLDPATTDGNLDRVRDIFAQE